MATCCALVTIVLLYQLLVVPLMLLCYYVSYPWYPCCCCVTMMVTCGALVQPVNNAWPQAGIGSHRQHGSLIITLAHLLLCNMTSLCQTELQKVLHNKESLKPLSINTKGHTIQERKDYTFLRQFDEKPRGILGCPGTYNLQRMCIFVTKFSAESQLLYGERHGQVNS